MLRLHVSGGIRDYIKDVIAKQPPNRQNAASEGEERKRSVVTTLGLGDEAIAPRREGGWDEGFAITSRDNPRRSPTSQQRPSWSCAARGRAHPTTC